MQRVQHGFPIKAKRLKNGINFELEDGLLAGFGRAGENLLESEMKFTFHVFAVLLPRHGEQTLQHPATGSAKAMIRRDEISHREVAQLIPPYLVCSKPGAKAILGEKRDGSPTVCSLKLLIDA